MCLYVHIYTYTQVLGDILLYKIHMCMCIYTHMYKGRQRAAAATAAAAAAIPP